MLILLLFAVLNLITFTVYYYDKNVAIKNQRRSPEATLLILGLLGGWPSALLAQQLFRHKTHKPKFQFLFGITVLINILIICWFIKVSTQYSF